MKTIHEQFAEKKPDKIDLMINKSAEADPYYTFETLNDNINIFSKISEKWVENNPEKYINIWGKAQDVAKKEDFARGYLDIPYLTHSLRQNKISELAPLAYAKHQINTTLKYMGLFPEHDEYRFNEEYVKDEAFKEAIKHFSKEKLYNLAENIQEKYIKVINEERDNRSTKDELCARKGELKGQKSGVVEADYIAEHVINAKISRNNSR